MADYAYIALDSRGHETRGTLEGATQLEALQRIKEMGFFPTRVREVRPQILRQRKNRPGRRALSRVATVRIPGFGARIKPRSITVFTRQLATLIDAGLPLVRGLRLLEQQEGSPALRGVILEMVDSIEGGSTFTEALARHPRVFSKLYINMVKAGEVGGVLEVVLTRLAEFMEKSQRIKNKVKGAMFYPAAVMLVAGGVLAMLTLFVVPRFQEILEGMYDGRQLPAFTLFVFGISDMIHHHFLVVAGSVAALMILVRIAAGTKWGRPLFDRLKLKLPGVGPLLNKVAIVRFARTLGTLMGSGVPILQALTIIRDTVGNLTVALAVERIHAAVKEGEAIAVPMSDSPVFPAIVTGMVDVGEQTGALPDMLMKIADNYDDEVDNAVSAMTSLLEPIMIVVLAVIVGSIVIAMFWPIVDFANLNGGP